MAKMVYRFLMIIAALFCIFFLGAIIKIANPVLCLIATIAIAALISLGYLLGFNSEKKKKENNKPASSQPNQNRTHN